MFAFPVSSIVGEQQARGGVFCRRMNDGCPPKGELLKYFLERPSSTEIAKLRDWIRAGMPDVDDPPSTTGRRKSPAEIAGLPDPHISDEERQCPISMPRCSTRSDSIHKNFLFLATA